MQLNNTIMTGTGRDDSGRAYARIEVLRNGETLELTVYPVLVTTEAIRYIGVDTEVDLVVLDVQKSMPAYAAGLKRGDTLLALDNQEIESSAFLSAYLRNHSSGPIDLKVLREGQEVVLTIEPRIAEGEKTPRFGFTYEAEKVRVHRNPIEQLGIMANTMWMTLYALVHTGSDVKVRNMSGPVGIVHGLSTMARYGAVDLIWFLALINVNLALINLLPVPVLDGGHMLFATISKLAGRPLPVSVLEKVQAGFMVLLLGMIIYVSFFDVSRVGRDIGWINDQPRTDPSQAEPRDEKPPGE